jgi:hypothetical protein
MKAKSAKNKGNRYENHLIEVLRSQLDEKAQRTYGSGAGLDKNDVVLPQFDIEIEAKNQKTLKILDWMEQTQSQQNKSGRTSVMVFRNPRKAEFQESFVVMDLYDWIELVKKQKDQVEVINNQDPQLKWKIKRLKDAANDVFKEL